MEIVPHESVLGATIEFGGLESSPSQGLNQEPPLLYRLAHPRLGQHCIYALLQFVHHWQWLRLRNLRIRKLSYLGRESLVFFPARYHCGIKFSIFGR